MIYFLVHNDQPITLNSSMFDELIETPQTDGTSDYQAILKYIPKVGLHFTGSSPAWSFK